MLKEMGKTKKLIEKLFTGKKGTEEKVKPTSLRFLLNESENFTKGTSVLPNRERQPESPKKKRGWGFRRSQHPVPTVPPEDHEVPESWILQKKVAAVTAAAAKPVGAAACRRASAVSEMAAVTIQSAFRSYLARKALKALKGLVKVQALVRGYLVRKRTTVILHSMQSIATAQARARSQRSIKNGESNSSFQSQPNQRKSVDQRPRKSTSQERDWRIQGNIKIVEMDVGESKRSSNSRKSNSSHSRTAESSQQSSQGSTNSSKSNSSRPRTAETSHRTLKRSTNPEKRDSSRPRTAETSHRSLKGCVTIRTYSKQECGDDLSVKSSALTDSSRGARSSPQHYSSTAQSSPQHESTAFIMSEYPSNPETFHRVFVNHAYSNQERQDNEDISLQPSALVVSSPRADGGRFADYYLDTAQSSPNVSSRSSKPECLSFDYEMTPPADFTNTEPYRVKAERSRSAPRNTRADLIVGSPSKKKAAQAGTRPDSNEEPLSSKLARVGGLGKKRDYGSSPSLTSLTNTVRNYGSSPSHTSHTNTVKNYGSSPSRANLINTVRNYGSSPSRSSSHTGHTNTTRNYGSSPSHTAQINTVKNYGSSPSRTGHTNTAKNYGSSPSRAGHTNTAKNYGSSPSRANTAKNYGSSPSHAGHTNTVNGISHSTWK